MSPIELRHLLQNLGQQSTVGGQQSTGGGSTMMAAPTASTTVRAEGISKACVFQLRGSFH